VSPKVTLGRQHCGVPTAGNERGCEGQRAARYQGLAGSVGEGSAASTACERSGLRERDH